jgi:hypothetical protein
LLSILNISTEKEENKSLACAAIATEMFTRAIKDIIDDKLRYFFILCL